MKVVKIEKETSIKLVKNILENNSMCILMNYKGLTAGAVSKLRTSLKDKKANIKIFKNTLFKKAIENSNFDFLKDFLVDQIAISYSKDPISLSNVVNTFLKENDKVKVKIIALDGKKTEISVISEMAILGSFEEIRAKFIGVLQGAGSQLVGVLEAYSEKLQA